MSELRGYRELREAAAWIDRGARGKIRVRGEDRARLLHAMTTNHIEELTPGRGCYAFFLNAQGRILGDVNVLTLPDHFLLDTEPETKDMLYAHLDKYIIADDVTLEDATAELATLGIEGPKASGVLASLGAPVPVEPYCHADWDARIVTRIDSTGAGGFTLFAPASEMQELARALERAGAAPAHPEAARTVRLEHGKPRYGDEITEANLPQETEQMHAIHFYKGCYLGQEIVERIRSRGHVNRLLVRLELDSAEPPAAGSSLFREGREVGEIGSAVFSPALGRVVALAYVRTEFVRDMAGFTTEPQRAQS